MRFRLRTLLIVLALGPPVLWAAWPAVRWCYRDWRESLETEIAFQRWSEGVEPPIVGELLDAVLPSELPP